MTTWPNWVDIFIVTITLRACYNGYIRGLVTEACYLLWAVVVTVIAVNYWGILVDALRPWVNLPSEVLLPGVFWGFFLILLVISRSLVRRLTNLMKWERIHWSIQGMGMILGTLRGLWWSGFVLLALTMSGFLYMQQSVQDRSVLGPGLVTVSRSALEQITSRLPGAQRRGELPIPPMAKSTK